MFFVRDTVTDVVLPEVPPDQVMLPVHPLAVSTALPLGQTTALAGLIAVGPHCPGALVAVKAGFADALTLFGLFAKVLFRYSFNAGRSSSEHGSIKYAFWSVLQCPVLQPQSVIPITDG